MSSVLDYVASFHGGIKFEKTDSKENQSLAAALPIPERLTISLATDTDHIVTPIVQVGEHVRTAQVIAKNEHSNDITVHASSSGTVVDIKQFNSADGQSIPCIVIETDGNDSYCLNRATTSKDFSSIEPDALRQHIATQGIFQTDDARQFSRLYFNQELTEPVELLIINAIDCEPFLNSSEIYIQHYAEEIITGIKILKYALQAKKCVIAVDDEQQVELLQRLLSETDIQLKLLENRYPIANESLLKAMLIGSKQYSGQVVTLGLATAYATKEAIVDDLPLLKRLITLVDSVSRKSIHCWVRIGTDIGELVKSSDIDDQADLILGGLMSGRKIANVNSPVSKDMGTIIALSASQSQQERSCIQCGDCITVCPVQLQPQQLHKYARLFDNERLSENYLFDCIECGACNFVCPSHISLVQQFRDAKTTILNTEQAENNRQRYQGKLAREQKRAQEKKRRPDTSARQSEQTDKQRMIAESVARVREKRKVRENSSNTE